MKKIIYLFVIALLLNGCATVTLQSATSANRQNLLRLSVGMTKSEALNVMGTDTKTARVLLPRGYLGGMREENIIINNPYKNEILRSKDDKVSEVIYYVTDVRKSDGTISDDELTPLVFDNGKLMGWGWNFLQDNVQKYELRVR